VRLDTGRTIERQPKPERFLTMTKQIKHLPVVFRKFKEGDIIALFPTMHEGNYMVNSYQHVGQHGGADYAGLIQTTKSATEDEYRDLLAELVSIGYDNLKVCSRYRPTYG
jgi:hypothetical protein